MLYYIGNAAKKMFNSYWKYWKKKKAIHYVSSTHNIDTVLEKNIFQTLNLSEMAITNITEINVGKRKINIESTKQKKKICKIQKVHYEKNNEMIVR